MPPIPPRAALRRMCALPPHAPACASPAKDAAC